MGYRIESGNLRDSVRTFFSDFYSGFLLRAGRTRRRGRRGKAEHLYLGLDRNLKGDRCFLEEPAQGLSKSASVLAEPMERRMVRGCAIRWETESSISSCPARLKPMLTNSYSLLLPAISQLIGIAVPGAPLSS